MTVCFVPKFCKKLTSLVTYSCQVLTTAEYSCCNKYEERGRDEERERGREGKVEREGGRKRERGRGGEGERGGGEKEEKIERKGKREGYIYCFIASQS